MLFHLITYMENVGKQKNEFKNFGGKMNAYCFNGR